MMSGPDKDVEKDNGSLAGERPLKRSPFRALIQDFGPLWFTWCMNSGILAELIHECPYQFNGIKIISTIFFILDLALFCIFSALFLARLVWFGKEAYDEIVNDISELTLLACWPIAWLTLTALVGLIVSQAGWGGHAFTIVAYVMWWIAAAWILVNLFFAFFVLIRKHGISEIRLPTTIIIPAVSVSTVAVTGGLVISYSTEVSARLAVPVIITSFMYVGVGALLGLILTVYLLHELLAKGWPPAGQASSIFVLIGPMGQSAAALLVLGFAAHTKGAFAGYNKGSFLTAEAASGLEAACVMLALMFTGLAIVWTFFAFYAMIERAFERKLAWAPNWNSIIFPMATLTTATLELSIVMDSPAFRGITTGLVLFMVLVFLLNLGFTLMRIGQGRLLIVREDPRIRARMEEQQKSR